MALYSSAKGINVSLLRTMGYSKLFLFLSMYFYRFIAQVVADGLAGMVVTKLALRVGLLGLVAIT